jgi:hypothetical protein
VLARRVEHAELERAARGRLRRAVRACQRQAGEQLRRVVDTCAEHLRHEPVAERGQRALDGLAGDVLAGHALAVADRAVVEPDACVDVRRRRALRERVAEREAEGKLGGEDVHRGDAGHSVAPTARACRPVISDGRAGHGGASAAAAGTS